jgi:hypothetical protein
MNRYTVRFNLGAGNNFRKWKVTDRVKGTHVYYDPESVQFRLHDCKLVNQKATANKIHSGMNKSVCAWVACSRVDVLPKKEVGITPITYNPRETPNWVCRGENVDNNMYKSLLTVGRRIYLEK